MSTLQVVASVVVASSVIGVALFVLLMFLRGARQHPFTRGDFVQAPHITDGTVVRGLVLDDNLILLVNGAMRGQEASVDLARASLVNFALTTPAMRAAVQYTREEMGLPPLPVPPIIVVQIAHAGREAFQCSNPAIGNDVYTGETFEEAVNKFLDVYGPFFDEDVPFRRLRDPWLDGQ